MLQLHWPHVTVCATQTHHPQLTLTHSQAVKYFERAYELVRALLASGEGTRRQVDGARVNLGMARGNARMGSYLNVINYDVKALLLWKNRRVLPSGSAAAGSGKGAGAAAGGAGAGAGAQ